MKHGKSLNERLTWQKCVVIGLILGVTLGTVAYLILWFVGNQLEAQVHANVTEAHYKQIVHNERQGIKPTNAIPLGSCELMECKLQSAYGVNHYQDTARTISGVYNNGIPGTLKVASQPTELNMDVVENLIGNGALVLTN